MKAVFFQTSGLAAIASSLEAMYCAPAAGIQFGCSVCADGATSHETCGSRSCSASYSNQPADFLLIARWCSGEVRLRVGELLEPLQRVVAVVVLLLVDPPGDAGLLEPLGVGLPGQPRVVGGHVVEVGRGAVAAVRVDPAGPHVEPVGVGRPDHRGVVGVAEREVLRQRPVEGDVLAGVVAHRVRALGRDPGVHRPVVPRRVLVDPVVRQAGRDLGARRRRVVVERAQRAAARVGLVEDRRSRRAAGSRAGRRSRATPFIAPK